MALIFRDSRYQYKPLKRDETLTRIPYFRLLDKFDYSDNITIRIKESDRLDTISFNLYGTSRYDWILSEFNQLKLPFWDVINKDTIIAPSPDTLYNIILPKLKSNLDSLL